MAGKQEHSMHIQVRLGEPFWRAVGQRNLALELDPGASVASLIALLCRDYPPLAGELSEFPPHIFIDEAPAGETAALTRGAVVHLVWAVSGG